MSLLVPAFGGSFYPLAAAWPMAAHSRAQFLLEKSADFDVNLISELAKRFYEEGRILTRNGDDKAAIPLGA